MNISINTIIRQLGLALALVLTSNASVHALMLADWGNGDMASGFNNMTGTWNAWDLTNTINPVGANYSGPDYYGGFGGSEASGNRNVNNATPDYFSASQAAAAGSPFVVLSPMFKITGSPELTGVELNLRGFGSSGTNAYRVTVEKASSLYISESMVPAGTNTLDANDIDALNWFSYDPNTSLTTIGAAAPGFSPSELSAVGIWLTETVGDAQAAGMGISFLSFEGVIVTPVPEPSTLFILLIGGLFVRARQRKA